MASLGHEVTTIRLKNKSSSGKIDIKEVSGDYELVWLLSPAYVHNGVITKNALDYLRKRDVPIAVYATFLTSVPYCDMMETWEKIDFCFLMNKEAANFLSSQGLGGHYMPMGFHPDQYYPVNLPNRYEVSFMGTAQSSAGKGEDKRVNYIKGLMGHVDVSLFGGRYKGKGLKGTLYSTHKEQREVYSSSKINLDLPFVNSSNPFYSDKLHIKNRFFEIAASKGFMITARHPDFEEVFDENMVGYYDDLDSLVDICKHYLNNGEERERMSKLLYNSSLKHTYRDRFMDMFRIIKGEENG
jgi:hypothetical protein